MSQQPTTQPTVERDAAKVITVDIWNAVVTGQPLIQECVVGRQQFHHIAIVTQLTLDEKFGLAQERLAQVVVELGKRIGVRRHRAQVAQIQPLSGKVFDQGRRPRIGQHPPHLATQHIRFTQRSPLGQCQQFVVRNTAPQEERQSRRQLHIGHPISRCRGDTSGL